ncbi:MAG: ABC-F family ATP-binding cassette domain-containing protein [Phycisphaerales bacterium]|nr:ABC-F family ATP-binding cassette domain-containing protein [Phycisphaerales bacterium]
MISLGQIERRFGDNLVLTDASVSIEGRARLGVIGDNGVGKTTLIKILAGVDEADRGVRQAQKGLRIAYGAQIPRMPEGTSILDYVRVGNGEAEQLGAQLAELERMLHADPANEETLAEYGHLQAVFEAGGGYQRQNLCERVLSGLGFAPDTWTRDVSVLSGGEKLRVSLAVLMTAPADLLILDEPTNHLDLAGIEFMEDFVQRYPGAVVVVSHDREFLDATCTKICEVEGGTTTHFVGNYSAYARQRDDNLLAQVRAYKDQAAFVAKEMEYIRRHMAGRNSAQAKGRLKRLQRLELIDKPKGKGARLSLRFAGGRGAQGQTIVEVEGGSATLPDGRVLFRNLDLRVFHGEVLAILGRNGIGKSTLLRALAGMPGAFVRGRIERAVGARAGFFSQEMTELPTTGTVLDAMRTGEIATTEKELRDHLALFLFRDDDVELPVASLSGGEKRRLCLARLTRTSYDFLCLDEPTNHLDIATRERLEQALAAYTGAVIMISHDRALVRSLADRVFWMDEHGGRMFDGGYEQCLARLAEERKAVRAGESAAKAAAPPPPRPQPEPGTATGKIRNPKMFERLEAEIIALEAELGRVRASMNEEAVYRDPAKFKLTQERERELQAQLAAAYERWENWG